MQVSTNIQHPFPLGRTIAVMSAVAVVVMIVQIPLVPWLFGSPEGGVKSVLLMAGLVWITALLCVLPMAREQGRGPLAVIKVFFLGMGVRTIVAVVAIIIAVKKFYLPMATTAVATMMMYLPLLFVEVRMLADYAQKYDSLQKGKSGSNGDGKEDQPETGKESSDSSRDKTDMKAMSSSTDRSDAIGDKNSNEIKGNSAPCTEALA